MDIRLDKKVAIVTGAASGIGLACAEELAASGAKVALVDKNSETLPGATKKVQAKGVAKGYLQDVTVIPALTPLRSGADLHRPVRTLSSPGQDLVGPCQRRYHEPECRAGRRWNS